MAFNLRVVFAGLCAYLRRPGTPELNVVLVDTSTRQDESLGMHQHQPFMTISLDQWLPSQGNRFPDRIVPDLTGRTMAYFNLGKEEISFSTTTPLLIEEYDRGVVAPRTEREAGNFNWIPDLKDMGANRPSFDAAVLEAFPDSVAARVKLSGGNVRCFDVAKAAEGYQVWDFKAGAAENERHRQALGTLVAIEMTVPGPDESGGSPQIRSTLSGGSLLLRPPLFSNRAEVVIGNLPLDVHTFHHVHDPKLQGLGHFRWFYELLSPASRNAPEERAIPFLASVGPLGVGPTDRCPQLQGGVEEEQQDEA